MWLSNKYIKPLAQVYTILKTDPTSSPNLPKTIGVLLYDLATKLKSQIAEHRPLLTRYIAEQKLASGPQLVG